MIFAIHPVFMQQTIAVAYSQHFITYALYFLSCGSMLVAIQKKQYFWLFSGVSILSCAFQVFTMEYFWGLEMIRPLLIWIAYSNQDKPPPKKLKQTILNSLPYLFIFIASIEWRQNFFLNTFAASQDPNSLRLIELVKSEPGPGIMQFLVMVAKDLVFLLVTTWEKTFNPNLIDFRSNFLNLSWLLVAFSVFILWVYRKRIEPEVEENTRERKGIWPRQAFILSFAIIVLGTLPVWLTGKQVTVGMYSDRFALPAMWGVSILLVSLPSTIGIPHKPRSIILSILIGLSIGTHFRISNDYRWDWIQQKRFFWQLHWRAPSLEPDTAIFADGTLFSFVGEYPQAFAFNTFYYQPEGTTELPYWFFELDSGFHSNSQAYLEDIPISGSLRNYVFESNSLNSVLLDYNYGRGNCLWILDGQSAINEDISELTREALPLSDLDRIVFNTGKPSLISQEIFGREPEHQWCYYYQKADLARHERDWGEILRLEQTVSEIGFSPNNKLEWLPFIEANASEGNWERAKEITLEAFKASPITRKTFCSRWKEYEFSFDGQIPEQEVIWSVLVSLECD